MEKYILNNEEYQALDHFLTRAKLYDSGCYIYQTEEHGDFGIDEENEECLSLKNFIKELFIEGYQECIPEEEQQILNNLYEKLEDTDNIPSYNEAKKMIMQNDENKYIFDHELEINDSSHEIIGYLKSTDELINHLKESANLSDELIQISDNFNFYAIYNAKNSDIRIEYAFWSGDIHTNGELELSDNEKIKLMDRMDDYCWLDLGCPLFDEELFHNNLNNDIHSCMNLQSMYNTNNISNISETKSKDFYEK